MPRIVTFSCNNTTRAAICPLAVTVALSLCTVYMQILGMPDTGTNGQSKCRSPRGGSHTPPPPSDSDTGYHRNHLYISGWSVGVNSGGDSSPGDSNPPSWSSSPCTAFLLTRSSLRDDGRAVLRAATRR